MAKKSIVRKKSATKTQTPRRGKRPLLSPGSDDPRVATVTYQWVFERQAAYRLHTGNAQIWRSWSGAPFQQLGGTMSESRYRLSVGFNRLFLLDARTGETWISQASGVSYVRIIRPKGAAEYELSATAARSVYLANLTTGNVWR